MMKRKGIALLLLLGLLLSVMTPAAMASESMVRTLSLTENWQLTEAFDLQVPEGEELILDGANRYYIYEMSSEAVLLNTGMGTVWLRDTIVYNAGNTPVPGSLAELSAAANGIKSITPPAQGETSLLLPAVPGFTVSIRSSSNSAVIGLNGAITAPVSAATVNLVLTLTDNHGNKADTAGIALTVPAAVSSGGNDTTYPPYVPAAPTYNAELSGSEKLPVVVDKASKNAAVNVDAQKGTIFNGKEAVQITVPAIPDVNSYTLDIPVAYISRAGGEGVLIFNTAAGSVSIRENMLSTGEAGTKAEITIGQGEPAQLSGKMKDMIGNRPIIKLNLTLDGKQTEWNNPEAPVMISIPYTPTALELANPESIIIWYIDGSGSAISVPNGHYDPSTGAVTFTTTHFSDYAVGYNKVSFKDVASTAWYSEEVGFIAARGITGGTGGGNFSPNAKLKRGEFLVMLMKAYGIAQDASPADNFADAGNTYYTGYLAAAKRLGISAGKGGNRFEPEKEITRQEMFTLLYNGLKAIKQLPQGSSGQTLDSFPDAGQIDSWAEDAMALLVETGVIGGKAGKLMPLDLTTRAEMAQVLYNLLSQ